MILFARAEGRGMPAIAVALGVSLATAYRRHDAARAKLRAALDREQAKTKALGVAVLPLTIDQLLASDRTASALPTETMDRVWRALEPVMLADEKAGGQGDDRADVRRPGRGARALRALSDPRVSHALAAVMSAAGGAFMTYQVMTAPERRHDPGVDVPVLGAESARPTPSPGPPSAGSSAGEEARELRADAGAQERPDAGPPTSASARQNIAAEQALFDKGSTAYQDRDYAGAIEAFRAHAGKYPSGQYAEARDRLLTLALIRAGRTGEARTRIERLRRSTPESPLLGEFDDALNPHD
jgi:hypothetical protein